MSDATSPQQPSQSGDDTETGSTRAHIERDREGSHSDKRLGVSITGGTVIGNVSDINHGTVYIHIQSKVEPNARTTRLTLLERLQSFWNNIISKLRLLGIS